MKVEDLTICPSWEDCFIAKKNKNGTMSQQRKALTENEMAEVIAFYGANKLENGYKQEIPLRDGTKVVIVHTDEDKVITTEKKIWHKESDHPQTDIHIQFTTQTPKRWLSAIMTSGKGGSSTVNTIEAVT